MPRLVRLLPHSPLFCGIRPTSLRCGLSVPPKNALILRGKKKTGENMQVKMPTAEMVDIALLKPYKKNTKRHNQTQIDNVAESIRKFGFVQPFVIDKNNEVVIGHCRLLAAQKLGIKELPCVRVDYLTAAQVKALRILDNKLNESEWDLDFLNEELPEIDLTGFDVDFDFALSADGFDEIVEDEPPAVDEQNEPMTKLGDIWQLGDHRLMCGDSTDKATVEMLMNGQKADMVFTDPPYGYEYQSNMRTKSKKFDVLQNDDKILDFMPIVKEQCRGFVFVCTTWKVLDKWLPLFNKYFD